jgi:hypothetical protein
MKTSNVFLAASGIGFLILPGFLTSVQAQIDDESIPVEEEAIPFQIEPRYSIDYNSSGGGYDGFGGVEIFFPIQQEADGHIQYIDGRLNLTNDADVGGNLAFGVRTLGDCWLVQGECIFGGYIGMDLTDTGESFFPQFGVGLEMLGDLDLRVNGYLPIGDATQTVDKAQFLTPTGAEFRGNNLVFLDSNNPGVAEVVLTGFDAEVGGRVIDFGDGGDLRAYGGVYHYDGENVDAFWGGRFRLEARPTNYVRISGGIQFDDEFGTNVLLQVSASLPNTQPAAETEAPNLYARMAEPLGRLNSVAVTERSIPAIEVAIDPTTGEIIDIIHVDPNRGNSNGTFENPFRTIAEATAAATGATDIIYVQPGNAGGAFTIPDGVAVLSVAPLQSVETQIGTFILPGSGRGDIAQPILDFDFDETITMGNDTVLSGFNIRRSRPPGPFGAFAVTTSVVAQDVSNFSISENTIGGEVAINNAAAFTVSNNTRNDLNFIRVGDSENFSVVGNVSGNIEVYNSNSFDILNNEIRFFRPYNLSIRSSDNFVVSGNIVEGREGIALRNIFIPNQPVRIEDSSDFSILNNSFTTNSNNPPLRITGSRNFSVSNNSILIDLENNSIEITNPAGNIEVIDNTLRANQDGVRIESKQPFTTACVTFSGNVSQTTNGTLSRYRFINNAGFGAFQIIDSNPTFTDTQASNIGTFSFEPDISNFTNVTACP